MDVSQDLISTNDCTEIHLHLESLMVWRKRFMARDIHNEGKEETKFDSLLIASHFRSADHMTLEGEELWRGRGGSGGSLPDF